MLDFFSRVSKKWPWQIIITCLILTIPVALGIPRLQVKTSQQDLIPTKYESARTIRDLDARFGGLAYEDVIMQGVDLTSYPAVKKLMLLEEDIARQSWKNDIASVDQYLGGFSANVLKEAGVPNLTTLFKNYEGTMVPSPLDPTQIVPFSTAITQGVQLYLADPVANKWLIEKGNLLTPDHQAGLVRVKLQPNLGQTGTTRMASIVEDYFPAYFSDVPGMSIAVTGDPSTTKDLESYVYSSTWLLILVALAFLIAILFFAFRRWTDILLPLLIIGLTVVWVFGLMGWFNITFSLISGAIAPLMLGVNIADCIYMMSRFYEQRQIGMDARLSAGKAITTVGVGVMLTAVCTFFGFGSFLLSDLPALGQFGIMSAVGVGICFILSVTLLPAIMIVREDRHMAKGSKKIFGMRSFMKGEHAPLERLLKGSSGLAQRRPWTVLGITLVVVLGGFAGTFKIQTTSDLRTLIPRSLPSIKNQFLEEQIFGGQQEDVVLVTGDILTPEVLTAIHNYQMQLGRHKEFFTTTGIVTVGELIYDATLALHPERFPTPESMSFTSVITSEPGGVRAAYENNVVTNFGPQYGLLTANFRNTIIDVRSAAAANSEDIVNKNDLLHSTLQDTLLLPGVSSEVGGITPLTADLEKNLVPTQIWTSVIALLLSGLFLMFVFRSLGLAMATLSVLLVGVATEMAFLLIIGWPMDMLTVLVAAMIIGMGIDFSIHITNRFIEEWGGGRSAAGDALDRTVLRVGRPLVFSAIATAGSFLIIMLSALTIIRRFGAVTAVTLVTSLIASVLILPALIVVLERRKEAPEPAEEGLRKPAEEPLKS